MAIAPVATESDAARFFAKISIDPETNCWLWTASLGRGGYGQFRGLHGRVVRSHRWAYEFERGPVPEGLELDHLCRVRRCVNPEHLEPVTRTENMRRGDRAAYGSWQAAKTQCPAGHPYDAANTAINVKGGRVCRACRRARMRAVRASRRVMAR